MRYGPDCSWERHDNRGDPSASIFNRIGARPMAQQTVPGLGQHSTPMAPPYLAFVIVRL
jgi:hypothetical protein